ncbi:MAG: family 10 glycosylhydrolase [Armatimonadota bacterium]
MILNRRDLIVSIDCTKDYPSDQYFERGNTYIAETALGSYREAESAPLARFGYRFDIQHPGKPHVAVIRYPDDKRRYMCIMDGTSYDLTTGVFTGWAQPISNQMQELQLLFWPRWKQCSIVFTTWDEDEPAAVSSFEVFGLDKLPKLESKSADGRQNRRQLGIQYEDPCGTGFSEGAVDRRTWTENVAAYALHTGQKLLKYPIVWYHGPFYPSDIEPASYMEMVAAEDRKQYVRWSTSPNDWVKEMLDRLEAAGIDFEATLTLLRLGSLMEKMNMDLESIQSGADTINNVLWNGDVQSGTMDWTVTYNVRNFPGLLDLHGGPTSTAGFHWAYGEKDNQPYGPGPIFNPLHPTVQKSILGLITEIAERYGSHPAFRGISFNLWHSSMLWFGSLRSGYDDYTISLFEQETGIVVPADSSTADRFSQRYAFLTYNCREAWVQWRCEKVRELFRKIRDAAHALNPDLRITITLFTEMTVPCLLGEVGTAHQLHARASNYNIFRDGGLDIALYRNEPGIEVDYQMEPSRDRGTNVMGVNQSLEKCCMYRDHDFLDAQMLDEMRRLDCPGVFIFNSWVEAWGTHKWFVPEPGDSNLENVALIGDEPAEGVFRFNSEYPEDDFWWSEQLRITPASPRGTHFMEHYAHSVAEFDACTITRGGLFLDKAHSDQIRRFAGAFNALPASRFETVGSSSDPVTVRTLLEDGIRYIYVVNRECYPISLELILNDIPTEVVNLATGEQLDRSKKWRFVAAPYELKAFGISADVEVVDFAAIPPKEVVSLLSAESRKAIQAIQFAASSGKYVPGMEKIRDDIELALQSGQLAWLRRALCSYIVRKCRQIAG